MSKTSAERRSGRPTLSLERLLGAARAAWKAHREQTERDWDLLSAEQARVPTLE